jgi:hypothetical protein
MWACLPCTTGDGDDDRGRRGGLQRERVHGDAREALHSERAARRGRGAPRARRDAVAPVDTRAWGPRRAVPCGRSPCCCSCCFSGARGGGGGGAPAAATQQWRALGDPLRSQSRGCAGCIADGCQNMRRLCSVDLLCRICGMCHLHTCVCVCPKRFGMLCDTGLVLVVSSEYRHRTKVNARAEGSL